MNSRFLILEFCLSNDIDYQKRIILFLFTKYMSHKNDVATSRYDCISQRKCRGLAQNLLNIWDVDIEGILNNMAYWDHLLWFLFKVMWAINVVSLQTAMIVYLNKNASFEYKRYPVKCISFHILDLVQE